ncbi:MAG: dihydroneopterin aldolase [Ginsengibacter sp.]
MITIHLHNVLFYSYHGIDDEEKILGTEFELSATIQFHEEQEVINSIKQTINYVDVYEIIKHRMNIPSTLLETVVMDIGMSIKNKYDNIRSISIHLKKVHPPITGFQGSVGVSWQKEF